MVFQDAPAVFDRVVLAMVRRIIHQLDFQSGGIREHHHAVHELGPMTRILRAVIQVDHQAAGVGIPGLVRLPPLDQAVHDEITGPVRGRDEDAQRARGQVQDPLRHQFLSGLGVVIPGLGRLGPRRIPRLGNSPPPPPRPWRPWRSGSRPGRRRPHRFSRRTFAKIASVSCPTIFFCRLGASRTRRSL